LLSVSPKLRADERRCVRTAKPCGPGRRCYGQALAKAAVASTGAVPVNFAGVREARRNSAPGRARHKPSDHCAGKAVCTASPVCRCAVFLRVLSHSGSWVPAGIRPSLRPLSLKGDGESKARAKCAARMRRCVCDSKCEPEERSRCPLLRHCERSEAIQTATRGKILDCFAALAMTMWEQHANASPMSSRRRPGPITTGRGLTKTSRPERRLSASINHAVWVPAFAGTTPGVWLATPPTLPVGSRTPAARTNARPARS